MYIILIVKDKLEKKKKKKMNIHGQTGKQTKNIMELIGIISEQMEKQ